MISNKELKDRAVKVNELLHDNTLIFIDALSKNEHLDGEILYKFIYEFIKTHYIEGYNSGIDMCNEMIFKKNKKNT